MCPHSVTYTPTRVLLGVFARARAADLPVVGCFAAVGHGVGGLGPLHHTRRPRGEERGARVRLNVGTSSSEIVLEDYIASRLLQVPAR